MVIHALNQYGPFLSAELGKIFRFKGALSQVELALVLGDQTRLCIIVARKVHEFSFIEQAAEARECLAY